jgi:hypothetical protein
MSDDLDRAWPMASLIFTICGLAQSAALRSPQGEALRAKRRARPTTGAYVPAASPCNDGMFGVRELRLRRGILANTRRISNPCA